MAFNRLTPFFADEHWFRRHGPDFIGVGPEKTGTSWIDRQLREHEAVKLPPVKELRYFWERHFFPNETVFERIDYKKSWHREFYRRYLKDRLGEVANAPVYNLTANRKRLIFDLRYLLFTHNDRWYLSCFEREEGKVTGEISPQYFFLPSEQIAAIHELTAECKIIISLRHPVEWVWSFARMNMRSGFLQEKYGTLESYIDNKIEHSKFSVALKRWRKYFPSEKLLILFFDDLIENPWDYYQEICGFLGIEPDLGRRMLVKEKVNVGSKQPIPDWAAERIREGWKEDLRELSLMVSNIPASWYL